MEAGSSRTAFYIMCRRANTDFTSSPAKRRGLERSGRKLSLTVLPHLWQTWWFVVLAVAGVAGLGGGDVRLVEKRKHQRRLKQLEQERALEHERARIAQDLHDDLGSSLARISLLSDLVKADRDNPGQVEATRKDSQSADQTVRALEEIVWALRPGSDSLQSLVEYIAHFANELFEGDARVAGWTCRTICPPARCRRKCATTFSSSSRKR